MCRPGAAREVDDFRASSLPTLIEMVAGGVGITLLPLMAVASTARTQPDLTFVPFERPPPSRTIGLVWRPTSARTKEFELLGASILAVRGTE